jgi:CheY-like chemotaxis protein
MADVILLVSDIPDHVPHYEAALRSAGYEVEVAATGTEALARAVKKPPACIVIDERVSGMTGWDACKRLKADLRLRPVPIVMLAQSLTVDDSASRQRAGCESWLARPTTPEDVVRAIDEVTRHGRSAPASDADAQLGAVHCPACSSERVRAAVRVGPAQYFFCRECGFYWRHAVPPATEKPRRI